ncbi:MAG: ribonuclease P protein component [Proteobacteria bacterium]|nr:ribonuclease P protein component [Pseudomonadota bacterium]
MTISNNSFNKTKRLTRRTDFLRVQGSKQKVHSKNIILAIEKRTQLDGPIKSRLGITITKKVDKLAVKRNQFKRRVREYYRTSFSEKKTSYDLVVIAKSGATEISSKELKEQLQDVFTRARLL